jgi:hypothetical protein
MAEGYPSDLPEYMVHRDLPATYYSDIVNATPSPHGVRYGASTICGRLLTQRPLVPPSHKSPVRMLAD